MADPVTISISYKTSYDSDWHIRLQVWVASTTECPPYVFLVRKLPLAPESAYGSYLFIRVCSYSDMLNYPSTTPDVEKYHYRTSSLDFMFETREDVDQFLIDLQTGIDNLCADIYNTTAATPVTTDVVVL